MELVARQLALLLCLWLASATITVQALEFPQLTGRIVDNAELLSAETEKRLTDQLEEHERTTTNQVVVITLPSLQGTSIEDFGYQLGRHWGIGQRDKNNGVILLVAPNERRMRIEVGYGLEGTLTDALSKIIIERRMRPAFRDGRMEDGIVSGTEAILTVLLDEMPEDLRRTAAQHFDYVSLAPIALFGSLLVAQIIGTVTKRNKAVAVMLGGSAGVITWFLTRFIPLSIFFAIFVFIWTIGERGSNGGRSGGLGGGGWSGGGGFSGGGGSFGGGGASGGW